MTIDGSGHTVTVSGDTDNNDTGNVRVFDVNSGITFNMQNLAVSNGSADFGGSIRNYGTLNMSTCSISTSHASFDGGGIYNAGAITATNCTFSGNSTGHAGGGIENYIGSLTISKCTFSGNIADWDGGGIFNDDGTVTITNSSFFDNSGRYGGGVFNFDISSITNITNSTFSGNSATSGGSGANINNFSGLTLTLRNTIITNGSSGNCAGIITNGGNNIDSGTTCGWGSGSGSMSSTNPLLSALGSYSGPTQTFALMIGSPAIDAGNDSICAAAVGDPTYGAGGLDQRGATRPQGLHCDIGAYEGFLYYRIFLPLVFK
jgi:hypothetical protein